MEPIAGKLEQHIVGHYLFFKRAARHAQCMKLTILRICTRDGLAQRANDLAAAEIIEYALARGFPSEVGRTDFTDRAISGTSLEMPQVPIETARVELVEEARLLDTLWKAGAMVQHAVQPGSAGARRTYRDKIGQTRSHREPSTGATAHPGRALRGARRSRA